MNALIAFSLFVILALASPKSSTLSPEALSDLGFGEEEPPPCREPSDGEKLERGLAPKGKAATFSLDGEYLCERKLFNYGERDSYEDFVVTEASRQAEKAARRIVLLDASEPALKGRQWSVAVPSKDPLLARVRLAYLGSLARALGPSRVARGSAPAGSVRLDVALRPVQDPDILFDIRAVLTRAEGAKGDKGEMTWRL